MMIALAAQARTLAARVRLPGLTAALPLLLLAVWLAATLGLRALALPDEGRYVGVAWEMLRSGNWLEPTLDGLPFLHKPPLWYWLSAASMAVFGVHPWAARLPSLLGALMTGASLLLFCRRWLDPRTARNALVVLATMPLVYGAAQYANHDMLVAGCITTAIVLAVHAVLAGEQGGPHRRALLAAYACVGLGVMTKGLIGAVLPGMVFTAWCLASRRPRALRMLAWLPGWALFLAIAAPWMIAMQRRHHDFLHYFFVVQQFARYAGTGFNNEQAPWFYPAVLLVLGLPWTFWLWPGVRPRFLDAQQDPTRRDLRLLMIVWLVVVVVFFSLPHSKLIGYILPGALPLAFLAAEGFAQMWAAPPGRWTWLRPGTRGVAGFAAVACLAAITGVALFGTTVGRPAVAAWRDKIAPGDRVLMLDDYDYDVPVYLQLATPVAVATQWRLASASDGWRRELRDAAAFDPSAGRERLVEQSELPAWLCRPGRTWVFGNPQALRSFGAPWWVQLTRGEALMEWRVDTTDAAVNACLEQVARSAH